MKLYLWDFDSTMYYTPLPTNENIKLWEDTKGESWLAKGWWANPESLNTDIFYIGVNPSIYNKYLEANKDSIHYLITGRLRKLESQVRSILERDNIKFSDILCNPGKTDTLRFKLRVFDELIRNTKGVTEVIVYDDRVEHFNSFLHLFDSLSKELKISILLYNSNNMKLESLDESNITNK